MGLDVSGIAFVAEPACLSEVRTTMDIADRLAANPLLRLCDVKPSIDGAVVECPLIRLYYGASDTVICAADLSLQAVLSTLD